MEKKIEAAVKVAKTEMEERKQFVRAEMAAKKKGLNLLAKMLLVSALPLLVLIVMAGMVLMYVADNTAKAMTASELKSSQYLMTQTIVGLPGDFALVDGMMSKGDTVFSGEDGLLTQFKKNTGIDIGVFMYGQMVAGSFSQETKVDVGTAAIEAAMSGKDTFIPSLEIDGTKYMAYVAPLTDRGAVLGYLVDAVTIDDTKAVYSTVVNSSTAFMLVLAVVCALLTVFFVIKIVKVLVKLEKDLGRVAEGYVNIQIDESLVTRSDEVGNISRAVQEVVYSLRETVSDIHHSSDNMNECTTQFKENFDTITESIDNVNVAMTEIAEGATEQAANTQTVGENMNDMGEAINSTVESVNDLSNSAAVMKKNNETVNSTLKDLIDISERTSHSVDDVQKQTNLTNESVQSICAATDIIADIANQTNLLSLNASIEAARAGEMGRGFAVVAEEIRGLADQAKESTNQIRGVVETLIQNSNNSVEIMNSMVDEIKMQNEKLGVTQDAFRNLDKEIQQVVGAIDSISRQLDIIENYKNSVLQNVETLNEVSQNNAASTEETAATMDQLSQIVMQCRQATGDLVTISEELRADANRFKL